MYAIGEIVLVVIGILIALQINSWNEEREKKELEIEILSEIHANLKTDLTDHIGNINFIEGRLNASAILLKNLKYAEKFDDSIAPEISRIAIAAPHVNPIITGYKRMLSTDAEIISNDSVRVQISLIYENYYTWLLTILEELYLTQTASMNNMILENFIIQESNKVFPIYEPENFDELKRNTVFLTTLEAHMKYWEIVYWRYKEYLEEIENTIININNEIIAKGS